ncbi:MAG: hypothetical protein V1779_00045 [bacterium]
MKALIKIYRLLVISIGFMAFASFGCNKEDDNPIIPVEDKGEFELNAKYQTIKSFPGGGGIFVISISTGADFAGSVKLSIESESDIETKLNKTELTDKDSVADIIISPSLNSTPDTHSIIVKAQHNGKEQQLKLYVDIIEWDQDDFTDSYLKRDEFKNWVTSKSIKYSEIFSSNTLVYQTYPQILIVEHCTFITKNYEARLCYHVMIPPDDWSMLRIRNRNFVEPEIAVKRETDGSINQIPMEEYPTFFGY